REGQVGAAFSLTGASHFEDADGDALTFSATGLPAGLSVNTQTGVISGTPAPGTDRATPYAVNVTASDSFGGTAASVLSLVVAAAPASGGGGVGGAGDGGAAAGGGGGGGGGALDMLSLLCLLLGGLVAAARSLIMKPCAWSVVFAYRPARQPDGEHVPAQAAPAARLARVDEHGGIRDCDEPLLVLD